MYECTLLKAAFIILYFIEKTQKPKKKISLKKNIIFHISDA